MIGSKQQQLELGLYNSVPIYMCIPRIVCVHVAIGRGSSVVGKCRFSSDETHHLFRFNPSFSCRVLVAVAAFVRLEPFVVLAQWPVLLPCWG